MKVKKITAFFVVCFLLLFLLFKTDAVCSSVIESLKLCTTAIIPTLFPFFVIAGLLVNLGFVTALGKLFSPIAHFLFKVSGKGAVAFIIGIICGYPTGAKVIANMTEEKCLDKCEAERLLAFCNNSGPLFVIGAVGSAMMKSHNLGVVLYIIHFLSAVLTGVFLRVFAKGEKAYKGSQITVSNMSEAIAKSIENAVSSVLNVCGYVVFFSVLCDILNNIYIAPVLEVTYGAKSVILKGLRENVTLILLSGVIGFGGICVMMQVQSAVAKSGLSLKIYILGKTVQSVIAMILTALYVNIFEAETVFSPIITQRSIPILPILLFLTGILFCVLRLTKKG